jgi:hypothetical protein
MTENTVSRRGNPAATRPAAANARRRGRPSKAALARLKVTAIVVAVAAFTGTLGGIVALNPGIKQTSSTQTSSSTGGQVAAVKIVVPAEPAAPQINSAPLQLPQPSQSQLFLPRTRTRGS